jgi:hypothetical protein
MESIQDALGILRIDRDEASPEVRSHLTRSIAPDLHTVLETPGDVVSCPGQPPLHEPPPPQVKVDHAFGQCAVQTSVHWPPVVPRFVPCWGIYPAPVQYMPPVLRPY